MKKAQDKYFSISDLSHEFHISKDSIELYGVQKLLTLNSEKTGEPIYSPFDKVRLAFITRAKNADYTIGGIKALIGELDLKKDGAAQIEAGLVYSKKKYDQLKDGLAGLDVLDQINVSCDLELLESYIKALSQLKYGLPDLSFSRKATPAAESKPVEDRPKAAGYNKPAHPKATTAVSKTPADIKNIEKKISGKLLFAGLAIVLLTLSGFLYFDYSSAPGTKNKESIPPETEQADAGPAAPAASEAADESPAEMALPREPDSKKNILNLLDFPVLKDQAPSRPADLAENNADADIDQQLADIERLLKAMKETQEIKSQQAVTAKEAADEAFFKLLVADLQKKYGEQAQKQAPAAADTSKKSEIPRTTPQNESAAKKSQSPAAALVPGAAPQADKAPVDKTAQAPAADIRAEKKVIEKPQNEISAPAAKPPVQTKPTAPPKKAAAPAKSSIKPSMPAPELAVKPPSVPRPAVLPKAVQPELSPTPPKALPKKAETPALPKPDDAASIAMLTPKPEQKPAPKKTFNPEALQWTQKSYESVLKGDAGEAIISASVALTLEPELVNAYINRSWAYSKKGQYDKAIDDCNKALNIDPDNALAYNNRGLAFQGKGDTARARADYDRACKLGLGIGCKNFQELAEQ